MDFYNADKFQFTPLREGRLDTHEQEGGGFNFNSRPSARGDRFRHLLSAAPTYFNSRPSARGDGNGKSTLMAGNAFQFTPLREGRQAGS